MPQHTAHYHWLSCSAKVNNLQQPVCPTVSDADFGDLDTVVQAALEQGWSRTANERDFLCPLHSKLAVDAPARAPRKPRAAAPEQGTGE